MIREFEHFFIDSLTKLANNEGLYSAPLPSRQSVQGVQKDPREFYQPRFDVYSEFTVKQKEVPSGWNRTPSSNTYDYLFDNKWNSSGASTTGAAQIQKTFGSTQTTGSLPGGSF